MTIRRQFALAQRAKVESIWPILNGSELPPRIWTGWPDGKKFAVVLTHDVEGAAGLAKCRQLMQVEEELGFRSSFNFVPEGAYRVSPELRRDLIQKGFEVGVHDLHHDGKLYRSRRQFSRKAARINHYIHEWAAKGFRSAFMLHNLEWLHSLDVAYDASTFDTDPFEPQPDGAGTIFPFWVPAPPAQSLNGNGHSAVSRGYVELPYTLPQDSTLFLLLREKTPEIWFRKLDWIAQHGGMALVNVHPDYIAFDGEQVKGPKKYSAKMYKQFLQYLNLRYASQYWQPLAFEAARWFKRQHLSEVCATSHPTQPRKSVRPKKVKIWIDLDNTPHVPFFEPVIDELRSRGFSLLLTARDAFQVCDLADKKGFRYSKIGRHYGKNPILKASGLTYRALQLAPLILREKPALGLSHGSRSQFMLCNALRIPSVLIDDYEFSRIPVMMRPLWTIVPAVIPDSSLPNANGHVRKYAGIKEDVYVWKLKPDPDLLRQLGFSESEVIVTVRPPATEAHYHNDESERLFERFMDRVCQTSVAKVVLLPRNQRQANQLCSTHPNWFAHNRVIIPTSAIDGLNLLWHSDLVVSGGGTMNREAAALGVPVYSIFRGPIGAVDRKLSHEGRLTLIESSEQVNNIQLVKRSQKSLIDLTSKRVLCEIVNHIEEIAEQT